MAEHTKPRVRGDWKPRFLEALAEIPVVAHAARAASIDYRQAYRTRAVDPEFAQAWDDAIEQGVDRAEQEAFRRGVTGYEEPITYQGQLTYHVERDANGNPVLTEAGVPKLLLDALGQPIPVTIRKHSDTMLGLILKGRRKKVFSDRTELTGADGGPMVIDPAARAARVAELMAAASKRAASAPTEPDIDDIA